MTSLASYREQREHLLLVIVEALSKDERFGAAWLSGSYSRNDQDSVSDIDISLVVSNNHSEKICQRLEQVSAQTSPDRYSLFSQFGAPALIHENNNNAPEGGTFTFVMYTESALMVDWTLIPQLQATRPIESHLLFDKVDIPFSPAPQPEALEHRKKFVCEKWAFFWMMTAVTVKYIIRGDSVFATQWIENLHGIIHEIERQMDGKSWKYHRGSYSQLQPTREKQLESIHMLCNQMLELKPKVSAFTDSELITPHSEIEKLMSFAHQKNSNP